MAEVEYLHVCDSAFMAEGGKHCIIGIFDIVFAASLPTNLAAMTVAMRVRGQAHEVLTLRTELARPNGEVIVALPMTITLDGNGSQFINVNMQSTPFSEMGRYIVKITEGARTLVSHSLTVQPIPSQAAPEKLH